MANSRKLIEQLIQTLADKYEHIYWQDIEDAIEKAYLIGVEEGIRLATHKKVKE